jgi:hypothetical protein
MVPNYLSLGAFGALGSAGFFSLGAIGAAAFFGALYSL